MGVHVWVRDSSKKSGGRTFTAGHVNAGVQKPKRSKLTWTRGTDATPSGEAGPGPPIPSGAAHGDAACAGGGKRGERAQPGSPAPSRPTAGAAPPAPRCSLGQGPLPVSTAAMEVDKKQQEIERLRQALAAAEAKKQGRQTAQATARQTATEQLAARRERLEAGFAKVR